MVNVSKYGTLYSFCSQNIGYRGMLVIIANRDRDFPTFLKLGPGAC